MSALDRSNVSMYWMTRIQADSTRMQRCDEESATRRALRGQTSSAPFGRGSADRPQITRAAGHRTRDGCLRAAAGARAPTRRIAMPVSHVAFIGIHVLDLDRAIRFYTEQLGFAKTTDAPMGPGARWVELTPPAPLAHRDATRRHRGSGMIELQSNCNVPLMAAEQPGRVFRKSKMKRRGPAGRSGCRASRTRRSAPPCPIPAATGRPVATGKTR